MTWLQNALKKFYAIRYSNMATGIMKLWPETIRKSHFHIKLTKISAYDVHGDVIHGDVNQRMFKLEWHNEWHCDGYRTRRSLVYCRLQVDYVREKTAAL